jgi:hypothetical protein
MGSYKLLVFDICVRNSPPKIGGVPAGGGGIIFLYSLKKIIPARQGAGVFLQLRKN